MDNNWIISKSDRILITGAAGFVGTKVVQTLLSYGFDNLRCLIRTASKTKNLEAIIEGVALKNVEILQGNLLSPDDCQKAVQDASIIYHLAAGTDKTYPGCFLNSVVATRNLLEAAIAQPNLTRFINTSSIAVYSNQQIKRGGLLDESCKVDSNILERAEPYTYGKIRQDELILDYAKNHSLHYVIVRPSVVFGPGKAKITARIGLDTFGVFLHLGLNNIIPLTYVDNCAEAIVLAGLKKGIDGEIINILDDDLPRSREFLKLYKRKVRDFFSIPVPYPAWYFLNYLWEKYSNWSEGQLPPVFNQRFCATYWKGNTYSNQKAKELLGWQPRVDMDKALRNFFNYMQEIKGHQ